MILMGMDLPIPAIRGQLASGIDIIVHLGRLRDKSRKVLEIAEVIDYEDGEIKLQSLYRFIEKEEDREGKIIGRLERENPLIHTEKLRAAGIREC